MRFKEFVLKENKIPMHIEHLEDLPINDGFDGAQKAVNYLDNLTSMLSGHSDVAIKVSVKWDGAPGIVCGVDPESGRFFVTLKHNIHKETPVLLFTEKDVRQHFHDKIDLADKLVACLRYLPRLGMQGVYQGDFLYSHNELETLTIDDIDYITFTPNTITYAVETDTDAAKAIKKSKIGVVLHTRYSGGPQLNKMIAEVGVDTSYFKRSEDVWLPKTEYKDASGTASLTIHETKLLQSKLHMVRDLVDEIGAEFFNKIQKHPNFKPLMKEFINHSVRVGDALDDPIDTIGKFDNFQQRKHQEEAETLVTDAGRTVKLNKAGEFSRFLGENRHKVQLFMKLHKMLSEIKVKVLHKMSQIDEIGAFIRTDNGFKVTPGEGFVAIDRVGHLVKLTDRLVFNRANFNNVANKSWHRAPKSKFTKKSK